MNKYRVRINGQNFILDMGEGIKNYGFYANRYMEANDPDDAEMIAVNSIRKRDDIKAILHNKKDDPPRLIADEIVELLNFDGINTEVEQGFTWYPETENDNSNG